MDVIPVLDIRGGIAVAGQRGERENYRPLESVYSETSDPLLIADALPWERLYIADLDGIVDGRPDYPLLWRLSLKKKTMVDAGVESFREVSRLAHICCDVILGTETIRGIGVIKRSIDIYRDRIIVSLDIKDGRVLTKFLPSSPLKALEILVDEGIERVILLNISSVGTLEGGSYELIQPLVKRFHSIEFIVGGGIKAGDLEKMEKIGVKAVLVGTALHRGLLRM